METLLWQCRGVRAMEWLAAAIMCVLAGQAPAQGSVAADREALEAFYHATGGPKNWHSGTKWLSAAPLSEWYGVTTDESGRVTELELTIRNLTGTIPPELGRLSQLQTLELGWNQMAGLTGSIPPELGQLSRLQTLELGVNQLTGSIPPELGQLSRLQRLDLTWNGGNQLTGSIPPELGRLIQLHTLILGSNQLTGSIPPELGRLTQLHRLDLWGNQLTGSIPPELGQLTELERLTLEHNRLAGTIPPELGRLIRLKWLNLGWNPLTGAIPLNLTRLSRLKTLDLQNTQVCVPADVGLQEWLDSIATFRSSGLVCERTMRVLFSASKYEVREGESVTVSVRLIDPAGDPGRSVRIGLTVLAGGSATAADYSGVPEHIDIPAGGGEASFAVRAVRDNRLDPGETLILGFRQPLPPGVTAGYPDLATVTIHEPGYKAMTDREVLDVFYHATGGPNWNDRTNWLSAAPLSDWHGVTTDESGRVTALELWNNSLRGRLPPALVRLTQLQELELSENQLGGTIPPALGGLTQLQRLALRFSSLRGTIPPELGQLTNLAVLELGYNSLRGTIPPELGQLTNLRLLELQSNRLSGAIPPELGRLTNLRLLEIADNRLSGTIPPELGQWTKLTLLQLQLNNLSGTIPPELGQLTNLRWLHLHHNRLSGRIPPELGGLSSLNDLILRNNPLIGPIPHDLMQLSELAELDIRDTQVCVPGDAAFQAWLETIHTFNSSSRACNGTRRVLFSAASYEVREGESVRVSVRLIDPAGDPGRSVRIGLTVLAGGSATAADYSGVPEHIDIPAAGGEASFAVRAVRDNRVDPGETLVLGFRRPLPPGVTAGDPDRVTVTIHEPGAEGVTDREVLDVFYHAAGGPRWRHQANWLSAAPLSEWQGVTTDESGRVTALDLQHNQVGGSIPPELGRLSHLQRLDLGHNVLTGVIPPEVGGLSSLQVLHLGHNFLSGAIPADLGGLTRLEDLHLGNNRLSGRIPLELGGLTQLQRLHVGDNRLSGAIPPELGGLSDLRELDLGHNWLIGVIPPELGRLAQLRVLRLGGNSLTGTIPPELAGLTSLEELNLRFSLVGGPVPTWLPQLPLTSLDLMATPVCVPEDAEYREWLGTIEFTSSGLPCGRPADAMSSIDIAVFYTPAARRDAGGTAGIEALIDLMIAETNQAYLESGVNQQVVLVARQEVEYQEVGESGWLALESLVDPSDGDMDEVHAIRDQAGADLVHLIPSVTGVGGRARLTGAFGYTCSECDSRVFAHELGHNMGLHHDRYVRLQSRTFPYSRGYVNQRTFGFRKPWSARWRTIMSYPDQCDDAGFSCDWIMRFSNPNQDYRGHPLGVPGDEPTTWVFGPADAVRTLNTTRHSVASFRPRASGNRLTIPETISQARHARTVAAPVPFPGDGLFREVAPDARAAASLRGSGALDRATLRQRQVTVDLGRLARLQDGGSQALRLNLFEDVELLGLIERRTPTYSGGYALSGRLAGVAGGSVTLVVNGSVVAGTVRLPGATFRIRAAGAGRHAILQVDPSQLPQACRPAGRTPGSEH